MENMGEEEGKNKYLLGGGEKRRRKEERNEEKKKRRRESTNTYLLGGGEKGEWTPAEAADWFAKQYLPDLREVSVRFPEEWLYSGCSIQTPELISIVGSLVGSFMGNVTGDNAEHEMYKYLTRIPKTSRTALFVNYNVSMFQRFKGNPHMDQEFDIVLVFGELRKWLTIEVKAGQEGAAG